MDRMGIISKKRVGVGMGLSLIWYSTLAFLLWVYSVLWVMNPRYIRAPPSFVSRLFVEQSKQMALQIPKLPTISRCCSSALFFFSKSTSPVNGTFSHKFPWFYSALWVLFLSTLFYCRNPYWVSTFPWIFSQLGQNPSAKFL